MSDSFSDSLYTRRSVGFAVGMLTMLLAALAVPMMAQPARAQNTESFDQAHMEEVTDKAAQAVASLREFFSDNRVRVVVVLVFIVLGLTLWLLGARAGRLLFALLLGTAAILPGMYLASILELPLWPGALVGGLLGMLLGVFIFRIGTMLVGMCICTLLAVSIFTVARMEPNDLVDLKNATQDWLMSRQQEADLAAAYTAEPTALPAGQDNWQRLADTTREVLDKYRSGLLVAAVTGLAVGLLLQILARSFMLILTTATLGTAMVLLGVWLGLTFRGQKPEELLGLKPVSLLVVILVILGLGMLVQITMTRKRAEVQPEEDEE